MGIALPFKGANYAEGLGIDATPYINHNAVSMPLAVYAKKAYFAVPYHHLPGTGKDGDSVWAQHLGQVTYFTPGLDITPAWVTVYLKFEDNFIGQKVKVQMANSLGTNPLVLHDWDTVSMGSGSFQPVINDSSLYNMQAGASYWIEVLFETTINKGPGFYGADGIEGFLAKYWWSISEAPVSDQFKTASKTSLDPTSN